MRKRKPVKERGPTGNGYMDILGDGHPLAWRNGRVSEHRRALYDKIGPGIHPCNWCGTLVAWVAPSGNTKLYVDHVDFDRLNNDPANLVPACMHCNIRREPGSVSFVPGRFKTHCKHGHEFTPDNLYWLKVKSRKNPVRRCRQCALDTEAARRQQRREAKATTVTDVSPSTDW